MDSTANILQFCRLCLVKDGVNIPIFDEQGDIRQIYLKISSCLPVKVAREDHLPKKICDGCSNKLDNFYDFWRTSAESEKQLLAWLGATGKDAAQVNVKEEDNFDEPLASDISKNDDDENKCYMFEQKVEEGPPVEINDEPPPSKRPRRTAAVKAAIAMDQNSDDDGDSGEPITKMEDDSDETDGDDREPAFVDVPSTSADDQPGPSGVSKDGSDAPSSRDVKADANKQGGMGMVSQNLYHRDTYGNMSHPNDRNKEASFYTQPGPRGFVCTICRRDFTTEHAVKEHTKKKHPVKNVMPGALTTCPVCSREFTTEQGMMAHAKAKHPSFKPPDSAVPPQASSCPICKNEYPSEKALTEHAISKHPAVKIGDSPPVLLETILTTQRQLDRDYFKCPLCLYLMTNIPAVRNHLKKKHANAAEVSDCMSMGLFHENAVQESSGLAPSVKLPSVGQIKGKERMRSSDGRLHLTRDIASAYHKRGGGHGRGGY